MNSTLIKAYGHCLGNKHHKATSWSQQAAEICKGNSLKLLTI